MTIRPIGDRLLVRQNVVPEKSKGGIIMPDGAREKSMFGAIVAIGKGLVNFKIGDTVCFGRYAGQLFEIDEVPHLIIRFDDILAVDQV